jgi:hypothetical protein
LSTFRDGFMERQCSGERWILVFGCWFSVLGFSLLLLESSQPMEGHRPEK